MISKSCIIARKLGTAHCSSQYVYLSVHSSICQAAIKHWWLVTPQRSFSPHILNISKKNQSSLLTRIILHSNILTNYNCNNVQTCSYVLCSNSLHILTPKQFCGIDKTNCARLYSDYQHYSYSNDHCLSSNNFSWNGVTSSQFGSHSSQRCYNTTDVRIGTQKYISHLENTVLSNSGSIELGRSSAISDDHGIKHEVVTTVDTNKRNRGQKGEVKDTLAVNVDFETKMTLSQKFVNGSPESIKPYLQLLRIDRPIGTWLLFWPCAWGLALAAGPGCFPDPWLLAVFASGSLVMRGAGCTINDLWDRNLDAKVARTNDRPLASGAIAPLDALVLLGAQLGVGLLVLLELNSASILLGASSLGLVCLYPLVKRVSHWPQLVLGLTFNWGVLLGWCAVHGSVSLLPVLPLYAAGVCWTLVYDTIYAHQDKVDDAAAGIKSTALRFGEATPVWLSGFSCLMVGSLLLAGQSAGLAWPHYAAVAATAGHLAWQVRSLNLDDRAACGRLFRRNRHLGLLVFLGLVGGAVLADPKADQENVSEDSGNSSLSIAGRAGGADAIVTVLAAPTHPA